MRRRMGLIFVCVVSGVVLLGMVTVGYLFFTTAGVRSLVRIGSRVAFPRVSLDVGQWSGAIVGQSTFQNVRLRAQEGLFPGYEMRVQKADLYFSKPSFAGLNAEFNNARWIMPSSEPVVLNGVYQEGVLEAQLAASRVELADLAAMFPAEIVFKGMRGRVRDTDMKITGSHGVLRFQGVFQIETFESGKARVREASGRLDLRVFPGGRLEGTVVFDRGTIVLPRTRIRLSRALIRFDGDPRRPSYEGAGEAVVAGIRIALSCDGVGDRPKMRLSSDPPLPEEKLWLMLGTGRGWSGAENALTQGRLSPDVVGDFLDTFVLGGLGGRLADRWGVENVSLTYNEQERGFDVSKTLTDHVGVSYGRREPSPLARNATQAGPATDRVVVEYKKRF